MAEALSSSQNELNTSRSNSSTQHKSAPTEKNASPFTNNKKVFAPRTVPPLLKGWLNKKGEDALQLKKKRFFFQPEYDFQYLYYYTTERFEADHVPPKGRIDMKAIRQVLSIGGEGFFWIVTDKRTYNLSVIENKSTPKEYWIDGITKWISYFASQRYVHSHSDISLAPFEANESGFYQVDNSNNTNNNNNDHFSPSESQNGLRTSSEGIRFSPLTAPSRSRSSFHEEQKRPPPSSVLTRSAQSVNELDKSQKD